MFQLVYDSALSINPAFIPLAFFSRRQLEEGGGALVWQASDSVSVPLTSCTGNLSFRVCQVGGDR